MGASRVIDICLRDGLDKLGHILELSKMVKARTEACEEK